MPPPPAQPFASRIVLGPALRTQSDRRLVKLVREGYELAFEEIVRRYRGPLDRFAAALVGARSEDVTQDAFSKALLALRGSESEIELRPWLYRIVRNTALNDLRDRPPTALELDEALAGTESAAAEAERREEIAELVTRLQALPEPQRAAIVMRELEGLSHEEIAAALGVSGGAARQAIHRARVALRDAVGLLVPLPLLRLLFDHGAEAASAGGAAAAAGVASAAGGGATLGSLGAGGAVKVGMATVLVAGSVGAGVALQRDHSDRGDAGAVAAAPLVDDSGGGRSGSSVPGSGGSPSGDGGTSGGGASVEDDDDRSGPNRGDDSGRDREENEGRRGDADDDGRGRGRGRSGDEDREENRSESSGSGSDRSGSSHSGEADIEDRSGKGKSGGSGSSGSGSSGDDDAEGSESHSGPSGGEAPDDDSSSGKGSGESVVAAPAEPGLEADEDDSSGSGSGDESGSGADSGGGD